MLRQQVASAAAAGDISSLLNALVGSSTLSTDDYVEKTIGFLLNLYYMYMDALHVRPKDLIDLVDGILYLECKQYATQKEMEKMRANRGK